MVNLAFLEKFTKGNKQKMKRYINIYLSVAPDTFAKMELNVANRDWDQLRINAHSLKPQADYMGIHDLKSVLIDIENEVKAEKFEALAHLYEKAYHIHLQSEAPLKIFVEKN